MRQRHAKSGLRTQEQIREHYEIEKELADTLRHASKQERSHLYSSVYDDLFRRVPLHPQLTRKKSLTVARQAVQEQIRFINQFLTKESVFLEVGPGDCELSYEVTKKVQQVYAVDVSCEFSEHLSAPSNFRFIISDGIIIPLDQSSVDVAYSNQVMEHLHPEDAIEQLKSIYNTLVSGGCYICITPNRITGPHDISRYFDEVATGLHLREYTTCELQAIFKEAGFSEIAVYVGIKGIFRRFPAAPLALCESVLVRLPFRLGRSIARWHPLRPFFGTVRMVGVK